MTTPEYGEWRSKRVNDNVLELNSEGVRPMEEYLQVVPSELEIIKQDFKKKNLELEKKIEQLEEEKMHLRLDADVQKTAGLGKTSEQWRQEIQEERNKADRWERKYQETQGQKETLERQMLEIQHHQVELKARIAEL
ncbi:hypothetical protein Gotur_026960 [Gossypium turneri]